MGRFTGCRALNLNIRAVNLPIAYLCARRGKFLVYEKYGAARRDEIRRAIVGPVSFEKMRANIGSACLLVSENGNARERVNNASSSNIIKYFTLAIA